MASHGRAAHASTAIGLILGFAVMLAAAPGCGSEGDSNAVPLDGGGDDVAVDAAPPLDANPCAAGQAFCRGKCIDVTHDEKNCGACSNVCGVGEHCIAAACRASSIQHVVLIVQENHTFDSYFGRYCEAPAGSSPTCTTGRKCCERAPDFEPRGAPPVVLDDAKNFATDRDHLQACELQQINGGKMDGFVTGSTGSDTCFGTGPNCATPDNWALADATTVGPYWALADENALADRYHQPIAGGTASNNMYFATTHFQFLDNANLPNTIGTPKGCLQGACYDGVLTTFQARTTIGDLLLGAGKTFVIYADGYAHAKAAAPSCESIPGDCPYSTISHPIAAQACKFDASDIPFLYYQQFADGSASKDFDQFADDIAARKLPNFAYVKAREFHNEHPNVSTISDGVKFVTDALQLIASSSYANDTLVLLTWDEGGGFFDHIAPPPSIDVDDNGKPVPYGTRVPMLAIGKFARKGTVSHVRMEHSSVVRFLEYNFLGPVGQLAHNDARVNNIGSLLDATKTGIPIPE